MPLSLLLQTSQTVTITRSELTAIYIALGGTLFSALLAAGVSFYASQKAAATTREVASLTTRTASDTAALASQTAKELHQSSYKNDFYKMIIENRLKVWKDAERLIALLNVVKGSGPDGRSFYAYFGDGAQFYAALQSISGTVAQTFWMGQAYSNALQRLHMKLLTIAEECYSAEAESIANIQGINDYKIHYAGIHYFNEIEYLFKTLMKAQAQQIVTLHDVEAFLVEVSGIGAKLKN